MAAPLLQLGEFQFTVPDGVHEALDRNISWSWPEQGRLMRKPATQFTGPNLDSITLSGVIYPGNTGRQSTIDDLRRMGDEGKPLMLTDGLGRVYGQFTMVSIREGRRLFAQGGAARRIDFTIELLEYGPDDPGNRASPLAASGLNGFASAATGAVKSLVPLTSAASAFGATANIAGVFQSPAIASAASLAGFSSSSIGAVATQVAQPNRGLIGQVLEATGLSALNPNQEGGWLAAGLNAARMVQQVSSGRGPEVLGIALEGLQGLGVQLGGQLIQEIAGPASPAMREMVNAAASLAPILNVDPFITEQVRNALLPD